MAFDKSKDVTIAEWEIDNGNDQKLMISVMSYNGGDQKLQIGPRTYTRRNGKTDFGKAGRLTMKEVNFLAGVIKNLDSNLDSNLLTEK